MLRIEVEKTDGRFIAEVSAYLPGVMTCGQSRAIVSKVEALALRVLRIGWNTVNRFRDSRRYFPARAVVGPCGYGEREPMLGLEAAQWPRLRLGAVGGVSGRGIAGCRDGCAGIGTKRFDALIQGGSRP